MAVEHGEAPPYFPNPTKTRDIIATMMSQKPFVTDHHNIIALQKNGAIPAFSKKRWDRVKIPILVFFFPGASNHHGLNVGIGLPDLY